ncbi:MAG: HAD family hydrolase [Oscillospiraceae bacterium]|nr:HAD family hydrolase [Oscillospiraceae bacterium]
MKKLLIFDAFGTLLSTGTGSVDACRKILAKQEKAIDPAAFYARWKAYNRERKAACPALGFLNEEAIFTESLGLLYREFGIDQPYREDVRIMLASFTGRGIFPDVCGALAALRGKYRMVIGSVTDTAPLLENLAANGLSFDAVYTSESLRCYKPDPAFYRMILEREGIAAQDAVFIGDSIEEDVLAPMREGITGVLLDRKGTYQEKDASGKPDLVIRSLTALCNIL